MRKTATKNKYVRRDLGGGGVVYGIPRLWTGEERDNFWQLLEVHLH